MAHPPPSAGHAPPRWVGALHGSGVLVVGSLLAVAARPAMAQQGGYGQTVGASQERQLFGSGSGSGSGGPGSNGSGLDINNPIDLINRIRRSSALDDATPPASAVDQALKALEAPARPPTPLTPTPLTSATPLSPAPTLGAPGSAQGRVAPAAAPGR